LSFDFLTCDTYVAQYILYNLVSVCFFVCLSSHLSAECIIQSTPIVT